MAILKNWKKQAEALEAQTYALYYAYRDPRTPWYAKALAAFLVAYALSPVDLIPDFIPLLGYLDDLVILPLGVLLVLRLVPKDVMEQSRAKAEAHLSEGTPEMKWIVGFIVLLWLVVITLVVWGIIRLIRKI